MQNTGNGDFLNELAQTVLQCLMEFEVESLSPDGGRRDRRAPAARFTSSRRGRGGPAPMLVAMMIPCTCCCRPRARGLAESVRVHETSPGRGRHRQMETGD